MELPMVTPASVVRDRAVVCRALIHQHGQCRHVQRYLTGMIILPNNSMAYRALYPGERRRIRYRLQQTTPDRQRRRESLVVLDDKLCAHVGRLFDYVDRCGR